MKTETGIRTPSAYAVLCVAAVGAKQTSTGRLAPPNARFRRDVMSSKKDTADKKTKIHTLDSTNTGDVKIADDVVAAIAAIAAGEVEGVSAMTGNISDKLMNTVGLKNGAGSGVRVDVAGNMVRVDIALVIRYGHNVMETSKKVQDKVKNSIETMTGLNVTDVNIRITGVNNEIRSDK